MHTKFEKLSELPLAFDNWLEFYYYIVVKYKIYEADNVTDNVTNDEQYFRFVIHSPEYDINDDILTENAKYYYTTMSFIKSKAFDEIYENLLDFKECYHLLRNIREKISIAENDKPVDKKLHNLMELKRFELKYT